MIPSLISEKKETVTSPFFWHANKCLSDLKVMIYRYYDDKKATNMEKKTVIFKPQI